MIILHDFLDQRTLAGCISEVDKLKLERYDNPFERKWFLADKTQIGVADLCNAFNQLIVPSTCTWVQRLLNLPIAISDFDHYGGVFVYEQGDYLKQHVDAGIHPYSDPNNLLRKVATALLYLTPATLEFYSGDNAGREENPTVWARHPYFIKTNQLVLFANDDYAWHGVPEIHEPGASRVVLTVSYMTLASSFQHPSFTNMRTRAYFAHAYWELETEDTKRLRLQRASEDEHSRVYRTSEQSEEVIG